MRTKRELQAEIRQLKSRLRRYEKVLRKAASHVAKLSRSMDHAAEIKDRITKRRKVAKTRTGG